MARFVFKLEPVLTQRRNAERDEKLAVAAIERDRLDLESRIKAIQGNITAERNQLRKSVV